MEGNKPMGAICDRDGVALPKDKHATHAREIYLDTISGEYFMRISHEEKEKHLEDGDVEVFQGAGIGIGWFVQAPDYTLVGRHGERPDDMPERTPEPKAATRSYTPRPAKKATKKATKKAAKKRIAAKSAEVAA